MSAPVVWLGSLGSTSRMWDRQLAEMATDRRCILIEHPGHGGAPATAGPYSIAGLAASVVEEMDRLDVDRADVVGLSIGAMIAMAMAIEHQARVARLALLCTSAQLGPASAWHERAATVRADGAGAVAAAVVGRWLTPDYAADHPGEVAELEAMIASTDAEGYAACCEAIAAMDLRADLPSIAVPTLVIAGTADPATPPEHGELIASLVPGARFELVDAAHLACWEAADAVNALLQDHLTGGTDG